MKKSAFTLMAFLLSACTPSAYSSDPPSAAEKAAWNKVLAAPTKSAVQSYLAAYPSGYYAPAAVRALERSMNGEELGVVRGSAGVPSNDPGVY